MLSYMTYVELTLFIMLLVIPGHDDLNLSIALFYICISIADIIGPEVMPMWAVLEMAVVWWVVCNITMRIRIRSDPHSENMKVAFYVGPKCPWYARIVALFTLLAHSVAPVLRNKAMVPKGNGYVKCVDVAALGKDWVILDTGRKPTDLYEHYFNNMNGAPVSTLGCVKACKYPLQETGIKLSLIPGILMKNLLDKRWPNIV